jgi:hypothetical protein
MEATYSEKRTVSIYFAVNILLLLVMVYNFCRITDNYRIRWDILLTIPQQLSLTDRTPFRIIEFKPIQTLSSMMTGTPSFFVIILSSMSDS